MQGAFDVSSVDDRTPGFMQLNPEQRALVDLAMAGESFYFGGVGGTGKSFVFKYCIKALREAGKSVVVCASTGSAAVGVQGVTSNSLFGLRPPRVKPTNGKDEYIPCVEASRFAMKKQLKEADCLFLDEASMHSAGFFAQMDRRARKIRGNKYQPFGGMQVIITGDFAQMPPIGKGINLGTIQCCDCDEFRRTVGKNMFILTQQMRQADDPAYGEALLTIRQGKTTPEIMKMLQSRQIKPNEELPNPENTVHAFSLKAHAAEYNAACLAKLTTPLHTWVARSYAEPGYEELATDLVRTQGEVIELKVGVPIILTKNHRESKLVNGDIGLVVAMWTACQAGMAPKCGSCDFCKSGRQVNHPPLRALEFDDETKRDPPARGFSKFYPLVRFNRDSRDPDRKPETFILTPAVDWVMSAAPRKAGAPGPRKRPAASAGLPSRGAKAMAAAAASSSADAANPTKSPYFGGESESQPADESGGLGPVCLAWSEQLPCRVAYGVTTHWLQGKTLDKLCLRWHRIFSPAQIYVALSRVKRLEDITIVGNYLSPADVMALPSALEFERKCRPILEARPRRDH
jgi:hypothetical protein